MNVIVKYSLYWSLNYLKGKRLKGSLKEKDYNITLGDGYCGLLDLHDNVLLCAPPIHESNNIYGNGPHNLQVCNIW